MITDSNAAVYRSVIDIEYTNSTRKLSKIPGKLTTKRVFLKKIDKFRNELYKNDAFAMDNGIVLMEYINL